MADTPADRALTERRLGLMILENKSGAALAEGVAHFVVAAAIWQEQNWPTRKAEVLGDLGRLQTKAGNHAEAAAAWREAEHLFAGAGEKRQAADAAAASGEAAITRGALSEGIAALGRAVTFAEDENDHLRIAATRLALAKGLVATGNGALAEDNAQRALKLLIAFKKARESAECIEVLGQAAYLLGRREAGDAHHADALKRWVEQGRSLEAHELRGRWADRLLGLGDPAAAALLHEESVAIHEAAGNRSLLAQSLRRLGLVRAKQRRNDDAVRAYDRALEIARALGDQIGISRALYLLGAVSQQAGHLAQARIHLEASLAVAEASGQLGLAEQALSGLSRLLKKSGDHAAAIKAMHAWVEVLKKLGDRHDQLKVLGAIAELHEETGAHDEAEAFLRRILDVTTREEDRGERARALANLGVVLARRGAHAEAVPVLTEAESLFNESDPPAFRLRARYQLGQSHLLLQHPEEASTVLRGCLPLCDAIKDERTRARVLVGLGNAEALLGRDAAAKELFAEAAEACEQQGDLRATMVIRRQTQKL